MLQIFLIVGLGNPGLTYDNTNHNVGFQCIDYLSSALEFPEFKLQFDGLYSYSLFNNCRIILLKPQTYMNLSGSAVQKFVQFYKIAKSNIVVIHDDLDLEPGYLRIKCGGSSGGHNGMKNIDSAIGNEYWRIRIGIGRPENKNIPISDYVLSNMSNDLKNKLPAIFNAISTNLTTFLKELNPKTQAISKIKSNAKL